MATDVSSEVVCLGSVCHLLDIWV